MKISITSGGGISNRKLFAATNRYFNNGMARPKRHVIPVELYGMVVHIQPYRVSFSVYNENRNYKEAIEKYIEFIFSGKTIGITMSDECTWKPEISKVNIFQMKNGRA